MTPRKVFVSYSHQDHETAFGIVGRLEHDGVRCWMAPRDVVPGAEWAAEIVDAIAAASVMVLVFSASANASPQVRREVERAVHRGVVVLPFRVEHVLPRGGLEYFLSSQHWMDAFPPPMEPHYARLSEYVQRLLASPRSTGLTPEAPAAPAAPPASVATLPPGSAPAASGRDAPSAATLQRLEVELARYVGPVARVLVQRAAHRAADVEALIVQLGTEIDSDNERRSFISASRQALRGRVG
jgi:hypothetical protein